MIIYKITNLLNNKIYIGLDSKNNVEYYGSGKLIKQAIRKYGKENFKKEIIDSSDNLNDLYEKEKYWVCFYNATDRLIGYNLKPGGFGNSGKWNGVHLTEEHKNRIKESLKHSEKRLNMWTESYKNKLKDARHNSIAVQNLLKSQEFSEKCRQGLLNSEKYYKVVRSKDRNEKISRTAALHRSERFILVTELLKTKTIDEVALILKRSVGTIKRILKNEKK